MSKKNNRRRYSRRLRTELHQIRVLEEKVASQQSKVENLYQRIAYLEEIEEKYMHLLENKPQKVTIPKTKEQSLKEIYKLHKKIDELRRANYNLRKSSDEEFGAEGNSISYFEHRLRTATIKQIITKLEDSGHIDFDRTQFQQYTTNELMEINRANLEIIIKLFLFDNTNYTKLNRIGLTRVLREYGRDIELNKFIIAHNLHDSFIMDKLSLLTNSALTLLNMVPFHIQKELLTKLKKNKNRIWNGSFVKGYFFLSQVLEYSRHKKYILKDIIIPEGEKKKSNILFKETLYEIFGNFCYLDENEKLDSVEGLREMASSLKNPGQISDVKGIFGELLAAYYYKKAYNMEIIRFQTKINTEHGSEGEIDLIALDSDNILWDIEVKNWSINSMTACKALVHKVYSQLNNNYRENMVNTIKEELEQTRGMKIAETRKRAILVVDRPLNVYINELHRDPHITFDIADLVPKWLSKGIYDPEGKYAPKRPRVPWLDNISQ